MTFPVYLTMNDHALTKPVLAWEANFLDATEPTVELLASLESHPVTPASQGRGRTATSLAIRMSPQVAMSLYSQLAELGRSMGWLKQE
jgi:hypothetical protein